MLGVSTASADSDIKTDDHAWVVDAAREIYPRALERDQEAQLAFSVYVLMLAEGKIVVPERSEWESQARKWFLEIARNDKNPQIAFNAAEFLPGIIEVNALGFRNSAKAIQCWRAVQDCWANAVIGKSKGAQCVALVDQAQSC